MFGFREIHEVKEEKIAKKEAAGYLKIKPEVEMTDKEIEEFWFEEFMKAAAEK